MSLATILPAFTHAHQHWIFAVSCAEGLMVYRSVAMRMTDRLYRPVGDFITRFTPELAFSQRVDDHHMMFGVAEFSVYKPAQLLGDFVD